jgi:hypothetical protein
MGESYQLNHHLFARRTTSIDGRCLSGPQRIRGNRHTGRPFHATIPVVTQPNAPPVRLFARQATKGLTRAFWIESTREFDCSVQNALKYLCVRRSSLDRGLSEKAAPLER